MNNAKTLERSFPLMIFLELDTISKYGYLVKDYSTDSYILSLDFVSDYDLVSKMFDELIQVSDCNYDLSDFFKHSDVENNSRFAQYTSFTIENNSIDGLLLKFVSQFKE